MTRSVWSPRRYLDVLDPATGLGTARHYPLSHAEAERIVQALYPGARYFEESAAWWGRRTSPWNRLAWYGTEYMSPREAYS